DRETEFRKARFPNRVWEPGGRTEFGNQLGANLNSFSLALSFPVPSFQAFSFPVPSSLQPFFPLPSSPLPSSLRLSFLLPSFPALLFAIPRSFFPVSNSYPRMRGSSWRNDKSGTWERRREDRRGRDRRGRPLSGGPVASI